MSANLLYAIPAAEVVRTFFRSRPVALRGVQILTALSLGLSVLIASVPPCVA